WAADCSGSTTSPAPAGSVTPCSPSWRPADAGRRPNGYGRCGGGAPHAGGGWGWGPIRVRDIVMAKDAPAYLVKGDDPSLVAQAARTLIEELVGERDPALVVEEHGGPSADDLDVGAVVDACTTPPFLIDRRVVVVRDAGRIT